MFTGLVEAVGRIVSVEATDMSTGLCIDANTLDLSNVQIGDSISVNGVCLTAIAINGREFSVQLASETLARTAFAQIAVGARVNLEKSLTLNKPMGGHWVTGHVDTVAQVQSIELANNQYRLWIKIDSQWFGYIASQGSVTINGVSLTVSHVSDSGFSVDLIPHTLDQTNLGDLVEGSDVNIEIDMLARYVVRWLQTQQLQTQSGVVA